MDFKVSRISLNIQPIVLGRVLKVGILTRNEFSWCSLQLKQALNSRGCGFECFSFNDLTAYVGFEDCVRFKGKPIEELDAVIVRPIGRGSLEEIIFRMDLLRAVENLGVYVVNRAEAIEKAVDKYLSLFLLKRAGLPVPRTIVTENPRISLEAFKKFNSRVVLKPIFGSRGFGITRVGSRQTLYRLATVLSYYRHVVYMQEYIPHAREDVRAFVVGGEVVASMRRVGASWRTNIAQGGKPEPYKLSEELKEVVLKACSVLGCEVAGVDVLNPNGEFCINEVNSQPDWRGLQSVSETNIAEAIVDYVVSKAKR